MKPLRKGVLITATDTGVGKTTIGVALAMYLVTRGQVVRPRKPVESGCLLSSGVLEPADALALQQAAGNQEPIESICRWPLPDPLSPERAAFRIGLHLTLNDLVETCLAGVNADDFLLVEGAGGLLTPLAPGVRTLELAAALGLPILLVAPDRLGCINHTLLAAEAIHSRNLPLSAIILNQCGHVSLPGMDNAADLTHWLKRVVHYFPALSETQYRDHSQWLTAIAPFGFPNWPVG